MQLLLPFPTINSHRIYSNLFVLASISSRGGLMRAGRQLLLTSCFRVTAGVCVWERVLKTVVQNSCFKSISDGFNAKRGGRGVHSFYTSSGSGEGEYGGGRYACKVFGLFWHHVESYCWDIVDFGNCNRNIKRLEAMLFSNVHAVLGRWERELKPQPLPTVPAARNTPKIREWIHHCWVGKFHQSRHAKYQLPQVFTKRLTMY